MKQESRVLAVIAAGVLAWGVYHAVGAYLYNHDPWRGVVVLGCVIAFLGFWGVMLAARKRRLARLADESNRPRG